MELYTEYIRGVHHEQYSLLTSTNMKCVLVAPELNGSGLQRHHCAHEKSLSSGQPCHLLAGLHLIFSLPVHQNMKHHLDSTTFSKTTLYTEHLFHNLFSRQAALKNHCRTSISRVAEIREQTHPQVMSPKSLRQFLEVLWKTSINYQLYDVQRTRSTSSNC